MSGVLIIYRVKLRSSHLTSQSSTLQFGLVLLGLRSEHQAHSLLWVKRGVSLHSELGDTLCMRKNCASVERSVIFLTQRDAIYLLLRFDGTSNRHSIFYI